MVCDVLLNSSARFAVDPPAGSADLDLFTVALHEVGHVLGLGHTDDPTSVMFGAYAGTRTGPSARDVADLQAAYGPRAADGYEGATGNNARATAAPLAGPGNLSAAADLTTPTDADYFAFVPPAGKDKVKVLVVTEGLSLLAPRVEVIDPAGRVLRSAASTDQAAGELKVEVDRLAAGTTYHVRVSAAGSDVFAVGRYHLRLNFTDEPVRRQTFAKDGGTNDDRAAATALVTTPATGSGKKGGLGYDGVTEGAADVDWYRATAPAGRAAAMLVTVRAVRSDRAPPTLATFDAAGNPTSPRGPATTSGSPTRPSGRTRPGTTGWTSTSGRPKG